MKALFSLSVLVLFSTCVLLAQTSTKIIVLDNENILEGTATLTEERYQIRTGSGEFTLPKVRVLAIVANKQEAFDIVAQRANRGDADERLRLAKWCYLNGMH